DIPVAMVDRRTAPPAGHIEPRQLVLGKRPSADAEHAIAVLSVDITGQSADTRLVAESLSPTKFPGFVIIVQQLAETRAGQSRTWFHGGLAKEKGPRERLFGEGMVDLAFRKMRSSAPTWLAGGGRERGRNNGTLHFGSSQTDVHRSNGVRQFGTAHGVCLCKDGNLSAHQMSPSR